MIEVLAIKEEIEVVITDHKIICLETFGADCPGGGWLLLHRVCRHYAKVVSIFPTDAEEKILKGITGAENFTNPFYLALR